MSQEDPPLVEHLFPEEALDILRGAVYRPDAERTYDVMSDGFWWSDERVRETIFACRRHGSWAFRFLMGYRGSLIRGTPEKGWMPVWEQVERACPNWPGFRPERTCRTLAKELHRAGREQCVEFLRFNRESRRDVSDPSP